jgi:Short C-terminal domain
MKQFFFSMLAALSIVTFLTGCETHLGGGTTNRIEQPTLGQQLIDLQRAKDAGAITDAEYRAQKDKLLGK